jgi:phage terminase large subunit
MPFTAKQAEAFAVLSDSTTRQIALLGGSRSGKSYTIGHKFRQRAIEFPGVLQFILRKTMADARDTVWLQTMLPILKGDQMRGHCRIYKQPALAEYTNGSIIRIGGLHPSEIDKILGSEAGTAWINEASEAAWSNIPAIRTRLNDRTPHYEHGRPIVPKLVCDFNPPTVKHWTHKAFVLKVDPDSGNTLPDADSWAWLQMNPYDNTANLSASYLSTLESMSERDKQRFLYGNFGQLKGLVYDCFDPEQNVYDEGATGDRYFRAIDFGFTNPFVCLWGRLASDDTLYITHELYQAGVTVDRHALVINELTKNRVEATYADHDAGEREVLKRAGIPTDAAKKDVKAGINLLYGMIEKRKIKIHRSCQNLILELQSYQWKEGAKGDEVIKLNDHAADSLRYMVMGIFNQSSVSFGKLSFM